MFTLQGLTMTTEALNDQQNLDRLLSRLKESMENKPLEQLMSAFGYTANLMDRYLSSETRNNKKSYYLTHFTKIIQLFRQRVAKDQTGQQRPLSKCKQTILHNILNALEQYSEVKDFYAIKETVSSSEQEEAFEEAYRKMQAFYDDHNLDKAHAQIRRINQMKGKWPQLEVTVQMKDKIAKIERQYEKMCWFYSQLGGDDWIFDKEEENIRLEYRVHEEERTISVRMFAQIEMEMLPFLAIASEIDFQKEYVPFVYVSEEVKPLGRNRKAGYSKTYVPLLTDRQCYFSAVGYDRMDTTGSIFLYTESYDQDEELQKQYNLIVPKPEDSEYVRLKVHYFCIDYKPLTKNRAQIRLVTKADFKLTFLPLWILQRSARIFTFNYFQKIVEKAKHFKGSIWQERVRQNPAMYNFFQKKINQYLK